MKFLDETDPLDPERAIVDSEAVPLVDLSEREGVLPNVGIRPVDEVLGLDELGAKLWYLDPGEEVGYHAHPVEEELYYVLRGKFSVKLGPPDDPTIEVVGPGTFFAGRALVGHGYRNVGDEPGVVLAIGAPTGDDRVIDPHES
ncbi:cupin domain-containing protein [Haloarchaeobius sp. DFWS5]|uniref:cupin domain-containing protein n=1 Tax=Haloarchaeobius sp. DFWS5 TaxID=3446114 RepID=UPI003EBD1C22